MKIKSRAAVAAVLAAAIFFCALFTLATRADDTAPTLYVNDEVWYKTGIFPLRVYHSVHVPISIFEQIRGVSVTFYDNNTVMISRSNGQFISFDCSKDMGMTQDNERFYVKTYLENNERYVPLITTCKALGLEQETYRSQVDGSTSVRICDGTQTKTFTELLQRHNPGALAAVTTETATETTTYLNPVDNAVFLSIDGLGDGSRIGAMLDLFEEYGVTAAFFITPAELETYPDTVLSILAAGHTIGFLVELDGALEALADANASLMHRFKQTTRLIRIKGEQPNVLQSAQLAGAGYERWGWHIDLGTTETEVRAALTAFRRGLAEEGHIVLRAVPDGYNVVGYLREFFKSAQDKRLFFPITPAYYTPVD